MALTAKEEKFCQEYVKYLNKTKAAVSAGYSKKSAKEIGYENCTKPHIQNRIAEIQKELQEHTGVTAHKIIMELAALGFYSIRDFVQENNSIKDISKIAKNKLKPVTGIKVTERCFTNEEGTVIKQTQTELKLSDKRASLVDLGRHLGIFDEDNKQKAIKIKVTRK